MIEWNDTVSCSEMGAGVAEVGWEEEDVNEGFKARIAVRPFFFSTSVDLKTFVDQNKQKIGIQKILDYHVLMVEGDETIARRDDSERELEILKGVCSWMKKELTILTRVNREMQCELEEIKLRNSKSFELKDIQKKDNIPSTPGFEQWKHRRGNGVEDNVNVSWEKEEKKNNDRRPDIEFESELQKAIMVVEAAAAASH